MKHTEIVTDDSVLTITDDPYFKGLHINHRPLVGLNSRAAFALNVIERFALIAARAEGEDSTGKQKLENLTPNEIVQHSCDVADAAFNEFEKRGWSTKLPMVIPDTTDNV